MFENHLTCELHRETLHRWEIYAWAVRDAMIHAGHFVQDKFLMRQKIIYDAYMSGEPGAIEPPRMKSVNKWVNMAVLNLNKESKVHPTQDREDDEMFDGGEDDTYDNF